ncbi:MAG: efflux RND transporter periplasmic adaptor subunit [Gammaproteobacteria bacterium]|nr:efflux RND transporter periplasmic adaptor subunit [Gammaproteobacteria bacterium]MDE0403124.1 efflux RND transporter periplasmic adaptor subunit [Gammaproteobacteria bacterium]
MLGTVLIMLAGAVVYWFVLQPSSIPSVKSTIAKSVQFSSSQESVLEGTGYVVARRQTTVSSKTTGKVTQVYIEEGMQVSEGQLLATLDDSLQRDQLVLAEAQHEESLASLLELDVQIKQARQDLDRKQELLERSLISVDEVDQSQLRLDGFLAQKTRAEKGIEVSEAALVVQKQQLEDMKIKAPFDGIVIAKAAQPGEMISPVSGGGGFTRTGICTIVDMDSIEVQVDVNEKFINRVTPDQPVTVTLNSYPDTRLPAEVIAIIPTADRARATVRVRIRLLEKDDRVLPDMGVSVSFLEQGTTVQKETLPTGIEIAESALLYDGDQAYVWVIEEDSTISKANVEIQRSADDRIILNGGLNRNDRVVNDVDVELQNKLVTGQRVRVVN